MGDEESNEYFDNNVPKVPTSVTWYNHKDYNRFRSDTKKSILRSRQEQKEGKSSFHTSVRNLFASTLLINYVVKDSKQLLDRKPKKSLSSLYSCQRDWELIGLETRLVKAVDNKIISIYDRLQEVVNEVQKVQLEQGRWGDVNNLQQELQESCQFFTQHSVLFAQMLAIAQYTSDLQ